MKQFQIKNITSIRRIKRNKTMVMATMEKKRLFNIEKILVFTVRTEPNEQDGTCNHTAHYHQDAPPAPAKTCSQPWGAGEKSACVLRGGEHPAFPSSFPKHPLITEEQDRENIVQALHMRQPPNQADDDLDGRVTKILRKILPTLLRANGK